MKLFSTAKSAAAYHKAVLPAFTNEMAVTKAPDEQLFQVKYGMLQNLNHAFGTRIVSATPLATLLLMQHAAICQRALTVLFLCRGAPSTIQPQI